MLENLLDNARTLEMDSLRVATFFTSNTHFLVFTFANEIKTLIAFRALKYHPSNGIRIAIGILKSNFRQLTNQLFLSLGILQLTGWAFVNHLRYSFVLTQIEKIKKFYQFIFLPKFIYSYIIKYILWSTPLKERFLYSLSTLTWICLILHHRFCKKRESQFSKLCSLYKITECPFHFTCTFSFNVWNYSLLLNKLFIATFFLMCNMPKLDN